MKLRTGLSVQRLAAGLVKTVAAWGLVLLLVESAFGADIYIQGSTAFRKATTLTVESAFDTGFTVNADNADPTKANFATFSGTMAGKGISAGTVNVYCGWSGSVEGIESYIGAAVQQQFLPVAGAGDTNKFSHAGDLVLSDVFQDSTLFTTPVIPNDDIVGAVPFVWMKNPDSAGVNITNMTHQIANVFLPNGRLPLSLFSANPGDTASVVLIGRYPGSGTRLTTQAEVGYGANSVETLFEFSTTNSYWYKVAFGNGYTSGSGVAGDLQKITATGTPPSGQFKGPAIGYVGLSDANTARGGGAVYLSYDGVYPINPDGTTFNYTLVINGQYTFWGYEHLLYDASSLSTVAMSFVTFLEGPSGVPANLMPNITAAGTAGIAASAMNVQRQDDGAVLGVGKHP